MTVLITHSMEAENVSEILRFLFFQITVLMIRWTVDDALKSASLWLTQQARGGAQRLLSYDENSNSRA